MREKSELKGMVCATVTPIGPDGRIASQSLAKYCTSLLTQGCAYTSTFGTTGEGPSFSTREKIAALHEMADAGLDMSRQIPGVMATSRDDAAELYSAISQLGCRAALIIPPYFYSPSATGIADFYEAIIDRATFPEADIILYNIPQFSGVTFTEEIVRAVIKRTGDKVVGIKDSTGDLASGLAFVSQFPDLAIFTGDDRVLGPLVAKGGAGMIGGMPNLFLQTCLQLLEGTADPKTIALAADRINIVDQNGGFTVIKALLADRLGDGCFARVAAPMRQLPREIKQQIETQLV